MAFVGHFIFHECLAELGDFSGQRVGFLAGINQQKHARIFFAGDEREARCGLALGEVPVFRKFDARFFFRRTEDILVDGLFQLTGKSGHFLVFPQAHQRRATPRGARGVHIRHAGHGEGGGRQDRFRSSGTAKNGQQQQDGNEQGTVFHYGLYLRYFGKKVTGYGAVGVLRGLRGGGK